MGASIKDEMHMRRCLELAAEAARHDEVPVGALVLVGDRVVGEGRNRCVERATPLAHAEIEALTAAFAKVGDARLPGAVLYCTLEPCFMCAGAALHARVARIVYAAQDPKFGACGSLADLGRDPRLNHRCAVEPGLLEAESAELLRAFFRRLR